MVFLLLFFLGDALPETINTINYKKLPSLSLLVDLNIENLNNEKIMNTTKLYRDTLFDNFYDFTDNFGWFIKAFISGLSMMGFTWFIVYKDSNIPGINPPSPFSPSKNQKWVIHHHFFYFKHTFNIFFHCYSFNLFVDSLTIPKYKWIIWLVSSMEFLFSFICVFKIHKKKKKKKKKPVHNSLVFIVHLSFKITYLFFVNNKNIKIKREIVHQYSCFLPLSTYIIIIYSSSIIFIKGKMEKKKLSFAFAHKYCLTYW